jgi:mono/diheme cytochrome c family protein
VSLRRGLAIVVVGGLAFFLAIQLVPYGRDHTNPPTTLEPAWNSPQTRALARDACFDCHSNETAWPWYTNVAPFSWLAQHDVEEGRAVLNFSEWDRPQEADGLAEAVLEGGMPPWYYAFIHSNARLSDAQKKALADGLAATIRADPPPAG